MGCAVVQASDANAVESELEESLCRHAKERLARYKCPRHYAFVDALPLNSAGKVQKVVLRERFAVLGGQPEEIPH